MCPELWRWVVGAIPLIPTALTSLPMPVKYHACNGIDGVPSIYSYFQPLNSTMVSYE
ncbi:hypothetical protein FRC03_008282, partial [Tulasnella sp. 419]